MVCKAGRPFVGERSSTIGISGDVTEPLKKGLIQPDDVADLFELAQGPKPGRRSEREITVFKSGGGGYEDLAVAMFLFEWAVSH
ncbi:hypothetical protein [Mesorhizobium escarrei]|uniref:Ornithine cyclodeaminase n=1 Tax=Mesorhizobium escarrei TaxID=666018 RepID=A0ABN8KDP8_9HYPH|nr:Ornithine cyclodeaminase [Mesorhizobium escarrei]